MTPPPVPTLPTVAEMLDSEIIEPREWPSEAETGWMEKCAARDAIDKGEIKTEEDAIKRFRIRAEWISSMDGLVSDATQRVWLRVEQQFFRSARKYLAEKRMAELKETKETKEMKK